MLFRGSLSSVIKGEINRRSRGAPASIPLQPSMHKPCLPPWPLTPQPLSDPSGGASSKRIPQCRAFSRACPPAIEQWAGVKAIQSGLPPSCSPWLINHTPAARRVPSVILCLNYQQQFGSSYWKDSYKYMPVQVCKRGSLCGRETVCARFGLIVWPELIPEGLVFAHDKAQSCFRGKSDRWTEEGGREWKAVSQEAAALTDLFCWTFPGESHLSEMLPAVRGLKTPENKKN